MTVHGATGASVNHFLCLDITFVLLYKIKIVAMVSSMLDKKEKITTKS